MRYVAFPRLALGDPRFPCGWDEGRSRQHSDPGKKLRKVKEEGDKSWGVSQVPGGESEVVHKVRKELIVPKF